ncbi:MAG: cytochrome c oxidase accessory protein CcoG, partial [Alkalimonas sp.]|nr:cytochrome c oxidase accessory protein CcoG [Alkalimonas sp.]
LHQRQPLEFDIIRDRGALFRDTSEGWVENTYILRIINKSQHERSFAISYSGLDDARWIGPEQVTVAGGETISQPISLAADPWELPEPITDVTFTVTVLEQPDIQVSQTNRFFSRR